MSKRVIVEFENEDDAVRFRKDSENEGRVMVGVGKDDYINLPIVSVTEFVN